MGVELLSPTAKHQSSASLHLADDITAISTNPISLASGYREQPKRQPEPHRTYRSDQFFAMVYLFHMKRHILFAPCAEEDFVCAILDFIHGGSFFLIHGFFLFLLDFQKITMVGRKSISDLQAPCLRDVVHRERARDQADRFELLEGEEEIKSEDCTGARGFGVQCGRVARQLRQQKA